MKKIDKIYIGAFLCLLFVTAWEGMFPRMEVALKVIGPFYFTLFRYASSSVIFLFMLYSIEGKNSFKLESNINSNNNFRWTFESSKHAIFAVVFQENPP
ncbi:MAG: hypothetical protein ACYDDB_06460 [bacterium]